jgi:hypothetical protein
MILMKKRILVILAMVLSLYILVTFLPQRNFLFSFQKKSLHRDFQAMTEALNNKDFDLFMSFSPDLLVQSVGGKDKFRMYLQMYEDGKEETGILLKGSQLDSILQFHYTGMECQALLREISFFGNQDTAFRTNNYLMGFKPLFGNWQFVTLRDFDFKELRKVMPTLSARFIEDLEKLQNRRQ